VPKFVVEVNFFIETDSDERADERVTEMLTQLVGPEKGRPDVGLPAWTVAWVAEDESDVHA
jgi:hypothetical protein